MFFFRTSWSSSMKMTSYPCWVLGSPLCLGPRAQPTYTWPRSGRTTRGADDVGSRFFSLGHVLLVRLNMYVRPCGKQLALAAPPLESLLCLLIKCFLNKSFCEVYWTKKTKSWEAGTPLDKSEFGIWQSKTEPEHACTHSIQ